MLVLGLIDLGNLRGRRCKRAQLAPTRDQKLQKLEALAPDSTPVGRKVKVKRQLQKMPLFKLIVNS